MLTVYSVNVTPINVYDLVIPSLRMLLFRLDLLVFTIWMVTHRKPLMLVSSYLVYAIGMLRLTGRAATHES